MVMTAIDLVKEAKKTINEVSVEQANRMITSGSIVLDVREVAEFEAGHIPNTVHLSRGVLEFKICDHEKFQDRDAPILIYCRSGGRSALATIALKKLGFTDVHSMGGGYELWSQTKS
jgi:rhodanese-related sulfurtransferase|tara:strand:- start:3178 stop:3528 length:351 start_codon:yes stop_codon:yes gene_type:complete